MNLARTIIGVSSQDNESLIRHISTCRDNAFEMFHRHSQLNGIGQTATGFLLELITGTTDLSAQDALSLLDGASPIPQGSRGNSLRPQQRFERTASFRRLSVSLVRRS